MSVIKIVVCVTHQEALVAQQMMMQTGLHCLPIRQFNDVVWDATHANPQPPCPAMALRNQFVVIGTIP